MKRVHAASRGRYGARKVWHQLRRERHDIARCTVERLMKDHDLQGVTRGGKKTTIPDPAQPCPEDRVNRKFTADAPNQLWVSDFTYVSTWAAWSRSGRTLEPVAGRPSPFIIDVFARRIVGWRVSTSMTTVRDRARTDGALIAHRARCTEPGHLPAWPGEGRRPDPSLRSRQSVSLHSLHRAAGRCGHRHLGGQCRGQL